jgi:hypothetical protein
MDGEGAGEISDGEGEGMPTKWVKLTEAPGNGRGSVAEAGGAGVLPFAP